jgi:hypothetical protein
MSLLSENSITFFEATNGLYAGAIHTDSFPGKVSVANAVLKVPSTFLAGNNAVYTIPLTLPLPKGAVAFKALFDVGTTFTTSGANTLSIGINSTSDLSGTPALNTWTAGSVVVYNNQIVVQESTNVLQIQVNGAGNLTSGQLVAKVLFI